MTRRASQQRWRCVCCTWVPVQFNYTRRHDVWCDLHTFYILQPDWIVKRKRPLECGIIGNRWRDVEDGSVWSAVLLRNLTWHNATNVQGYDLEDPTRHGDPAIRFVCVSSQELITYTIHHCADRERSQLCHPQNQQRMWCGWIKTTGE